MTIRVNGAPRTVPDGMTVRQLLAELQTEAGQVVVELNLTILKRAQHEGTILREGDQVEIVRFVGGGT